MKSRILAIWLLFCLTSTPAREAVFARVGRVVALNSRPGEIQVMLEREGALRRLPADRLAGFLARRPLFVLDGAVSVGSFQLSAILQTNPDHYLLGGTVSGASVSLRAGMAVALKQPLPEYRAPVRYQLPERQPLPSIIHEKDGKEMRFVAADYAVYGQDHDPHLSNYQPHFASRSTEKLIRVDAFYMDRYEVTGQEFLAFCLATGRALPPAWKKAARMPADQAELPFLMTFREAEDYAAWSGKMIPDEVQWEMAARGGMSLQGEGMPRIYPYGNDFQSALCNTSESGHGQLIPVQSLRDTSPYGIQGMCGNAPEWTSSWYGPYPGNQFTENLLVGRQVKVIRGGAFYQNRNSARVDARAYGGIPDLNLDRRAGLRLILKVR